MNPLKGNIAYYERRQLTLDQGKLLILQNNVTSKRKGGNPSCSGAVPFAKEKPNSHTQSTLPHNTEKLLNSQTPTTSGSSASQAQGNQGFYKKRPPLQQECLFFLKTKRNLKKSLLCDLAKDNIVSKKESRNHLQPTCSNNTQKIRKKSKTNLNTGNDSRFNANNVGKKYRFNLF